MFCDTKFVLNKPSKYCSEKFKRISFKLKIFIAHLTKILVVVPETLSHFITLC